MHAHVRFLSCIFGNGLAVRAWCPVAQPVGHCLALQKNDNWCCSTCALCGGRRLRCCVAAPQAAQEGLIGLTIACRWPAGMRLACRRPGSLECWWHAVVMQLVLGQIVLVDDSGWWLGCLSPPPSFCLQPLRGLYHICIIPGCIIIGGGASLQWTAGLCLETKTCNLAEFATRQD